MSTRSHIDHRRAGFVSALLASLFIAAPALAGSNALSVEAGLDYCGLSGEQVVCKIDVGHERVAGAESYEVLITAPDGSAVASGALPAGGASIWLPYAGDGVYSVTVSALGPPRGVDRPKALVAEEKAGVTDGDHKRDEGSAGPEGGEQNVPPGSDQPEAPIEAPATQPPEAGDAPDGGEPPPAGEPAPEDSPETAQCAPAAGGSGATDEGSALPAELECVVP